MMEPALRLQHEGEAFYFIADFHSLNSIHDPAVLRRNSTDLALDFLATGLDPAKAVFFRQSDVPEVCELSWILSTVTPMGLLEKCHSYKDKIARGMDASHGLFAYPVLMAADILLYDSEVVPVGKDQKQHVEVTRDIAKTLNHTYGPIVKIPEPRIKENTAVVPGTDGQKMSKSYGNILAIFEDEKALKKKVMSIQTDSSGVDDPKNPDDSLILTLYRLVADADAVTLMENQFRSGGTGYGEFKKRLFEAIWTRFEEPRRLRAELAADPAHVQQVLRDGAERARVVASKTLDRVRNAVGLG